MSFVQWKQHDSDFREGIPNILSSSKRSTNSTSFRLIHPFLLVSPTVYFPEWANNFLNLGTELSKTTKRYILTDFVYINILTYLALYLFMWWSQYVALGLMVAVMLADLSFDGLGSTGPGIHCPTAQRKLARVANARYALQTLSSELCYSACAHGRVFAAALFRACRSVIPVRCCSRGHSGLVLLLQGRRGRRPRVRRVAEQFLFGCPARFVDRTAWARMVIAASEGGSPHRTLPSGLGVPTVDPSTGTICSFPCVLDAVPRRHCPKLQKALTLWCTSGCPGSIPNLILGQTSALL